MFTPLDTRSCEIADFPMLFVRGWVSVLHPFPLSGLWIRNFIRYIYFSSLCCYIYLSDKNTKKLHLSIIIVTKWLSEKRIEHFVWLRITDECSLPEMCIWFILLIKSDLKWCIHLSRSLFLYSQWHNKNHCFSLVMCLVKGWWLSVWKISRFTSAWVHTIDYFSHLWSD